MRRERKVIATVETDDKRGAEFAVETDRTVTLRFPRAVYGGLGSGITTDFVRKLTPDEARAIGRELVDAADHVTAAEHVDD